MVLLFRFFMSRFSEIGIPGFTTGMDRTFDAKYGALPRSIADSLRNALAAKARRNKSGYMTPEMLKQTVK